jgi:hypothetical protein
MVDWYGPDREALLPQQRSSMRRIARPAGLVLALGLVAALPSATATAKKPPCKNIKVGKYCVQLSTHNNKGSVVVTLTPFPPRKRAVNVTLKGPFSTTCSDGSSLTQPSLDGRFIVLHGSKFSLDATSGGTRRQVSGHWTSNTKAVVTFTETLTFSTGKVCTFTASKVTV